MEQLLRDALLRGLAAMQVQDIPEFVIEKPKDPRHGDLAANVAFLLARSLKKAPAQIGRELVEAMGQLGPYVTSVEVAPNGFINFRISPGWWTDQLARIQAVGEAWGHGDNLAGRRIVVEFVSSNPTGPLTIGHGRQAILGDCICSLLAAQGAQVCREYYYNDAGNQMNILGRSLRARYVQRFRPEFPFPENGYRGDYMLEIAEAFASQHGDSHLPPAGDISDPDPGTLKVFREFAAEHIRRIIDVDLRQFRVAFDVWSLESRLYTEGKIDGLLALLREKGLSYDKEGAVWLAASRFGDSEDRVIVKSTGEPTYYLPDLAYHMDKHQRGFDEAINIHGADHHGYAPRMLAGMRALGYPEGWLRYVIHQMVSFKEGDEVVKMSTRAGRFVTLSDLCREVGVDVARYFFVMRKADSHLVFDLDLARKQSNENPVYYCQYVHARICSLAPTAAEAGVWDGDRGLWKDYRPERLVEPEELELIVHLLDFPRLAAMAALALEPHHIPFFLEELARKFHGWYQRHRIVSEDKALSRDRLYLADCVRTVMSAGLGLLGITAPEKM
ncbi:arginine--tRNA ligase [bacterium]|nr:arginine--tRNA ligase [bacterium]